MSLCPYCQMNDKVPESQACAACMNLSFKVGMEAAKK